MFDPGRKHLSTKTGKKLSLKRRPAPKLSESISLSPKFDEEAENLKPRLDIETFKPTDIDCWKSDEFFFDSATGREEMVKDPLTFGTYKETEKAVMPVENGWTGIFLKDGSNAFVIKIDNCIKNGQLTEKAKDIIAKLSTLG